MDSQVLENVEVDVGFEPEEISEYEELNQNGFDLARGLIGEIFFDIALVIGEEAVAAIKKELYEQYAGLEEVDEKALVAQSIYNACTLCEEFYNTEDESDQP